MKILVAEPLAAAGLELLRAQAGWDVVVSNPKEYAEHLHDCDALLVRSAVKVNKDVLSKSPKLKVVGRAGVGVVVLQLHRPVIQVAGRQRPLARSGGSTRLDTVADLSFQAGPAKIDRFARQLSELRYRAIRPIPGRPDFAIWSIAHIRDLRTAAERLGDGCER